MQCRSDIVCFGQQNWDVCWVTKQHLMSRLAQRGSRVLYVDPTPVSGEGFGGIREVAPRLWVFTHARTPSLPQRADDLVRQAALAHAARDLGLRRPVRFVLIPQHRLRRAGVPAVATIYFAEDEWTAFGGYSDRQRAALRHEEERLLRTCDVALAVSPALLERFRRTQPRSYLQENAVDLDHFGARALQRVDVDPAVAALPPGPRLGFIGQLDERLDQPMLRDLALRRPVWQFVLVGRHKEGVRFDTLRGLPNVHLLGYRPYQDLPRAIRGFDACLVPYRLSPLTEACNPLKVYEYLATGLPVVAAPLPGLGVTRDALSLAEGADAFEAAIAAALRDPAAGRDARLALAHANSWDARVDLLETRIDQALRHAASARLVCGNPPSPRDVLDPKEDAIRQLRPPQRIPASVALMFHASRLAGRARRLRRGGPARRILVARLGYLGDFVATLPMLAALRRRFPEAHITVAVASSGGVATRLATRDHCDEVRVLDWLDKPSFRDRWRGTLGLFAEGFDLLVTGHGDFLSISSLLCGAPRRVGLDHGDARQRWLTHRVRFDPDRHEADNNLAVAEALGATAEGGQRIPTLTLPAMPDDAWSSLAAKLGLPRDATFVAVHPGSKRHTRRWPIDRFAALLDGLLAERPGLHAVVTGTADEADLAAGLLAGLPPDVRRRAHAAAGATGLDELLALLDRAALVVSNDTGVMHLAHARGRPLLALLGPENDRRWGPYPLGRAPTIAIRHEVPCAPCDRFKCDSLVCLRSLPVDEALDAARDLLARAASPPDTLHPLERRARAHTWRGLDAAGLDVPAVAVVADLRAADDPAAGLRHLRDTLDRQDHPRTAGLALVDARTAPAPDDARLRLVPTPDASPEAGWLAALAATDAALLAPLPPGADWHPERLGEAAAALQRSASAAAVAEGVLLKLDDIPADPHAWRGLTLRRAALVARLCPPHTPAPRAAAPAVGLTVEGAPT